MPTKFERKQKKCQHVVEKETGIKCTTQATENIAICNAGLVNGLSEEVVYENFIKHGPVVNITMLPGKSCCFVVFKDVNSAVRAYQNINGKLNIGQNNKPLYLSYTETIPKGNKLDINVKPPGLFILENFITEDEENKLIAMNSFEEMESGTLKHRQVVHYGFEFRYDINNVNKDSPLKEDIPSECDFLWQRLKLKENYFNNFKPDQLTVNYYKPGQGIPTHVDTHSAFEDPLVVLSLGSSIVMNFKNENISCPVILPRRSLTIMSGECRYKWAHGITPRKLDIIPTEHDLTVIKRGVRISYTFRKIRKGECDCMYTEKCDSFSKKLALYQSDTATKLENLHVHSVYENIATHFSETRHKPWPNVLKFLKLFEVGSIIIDVGCGNGKYLGCVNDTFNLGCDVSQGLLDVCIKRGFEVFSCNCLNVPIKDNTADGVLSIAVIHHLANEERRLEAVKEMVRIVKINGKGLIYVWAKNQDKHEKSSYLKQDRKNRKQGKIKTLEQRTENYTVLSDVSLPVHTNRTEFQHQDLLVPWKLKDNSNDNLFLRFYHVFEEGELEKLCTQLDNIKIIESYYDQGNWCCIFEKLK